MFRNECRERRGDPLDAPSRPERTRAIPEAKENRPLPRTIRRRKSSEFGASAPRRALADVTDASRPPRRERPKRMAARKAEVIFDAAIGLEQGMAQIEREVATWSVFAKEKTA